MRGRLNYSIGEMLTGMYCYSINCSRAMSAGQKLVLLLALLCPPPPLPLPSTAQAVKLTTKSSGGMSVSGCWRL